MSEKETFEEEQKIKQMIDELVEKAKIASQEYMKLSQEEVDKIVKAMDFNQLLKAVDVLVDFFDGYQVDVLDYLQMTISKRSEKFSVASTKTVFEKSVVESISRNIDIPKIYFSHLLYIYLNYLLLLVLD